MKIETSIDLSGVEKSNEIQNLLQDHVGEKSDSCAEPSRTQIPGISEITPCMFVCGAGAARLAALEALEIGAVISAAPELPDTPLPDENTFYLRVPVADSAAGDISQYFDAAADLIEQTRLAGGRTLVHCVAGVSRSVSLCLAYLIKYHRLSLRKAFLHLRGRRQQARPNCWFFRQLIEYEIKILGSSSVAMVFNEAARSEIPDVYEEDYKAMLSYQMQYNRILGRR